MVAVTRIRFRDLDEREHAERRRLTGRLEQMQKIQKDRKLLSGDERAELERIKGILAVIKDDPTELCEPVYVGIRHFFNRAPGLLGALMRNHDRGVLEGTALDGTNELSPDAVVRAALTIGLCIARGAEGPPVRARRTRSRSAQPELESGVTFQSIVNDPHATDDVVDFRIVPMESAQEDYSALSAQFFTALGDAQAMQALAKLVLPILAQEGDTRGADDGFPGSVDAAEFANVMLALVKRGVTTRERQLRRSVNQELDRLQLVGEDRPSTELGIDFSLLDESNTADAVKENVQLYGTMICSAMFDELKVFQVMDVVSDKYRDGTLTTGLGEAGRLLYKYWKEAPNRMSEVDRRRFHAIMLGTPNGGDTKLINRDFNELWLRFVSSSIEYVRQSDVDQMLRATYPNAISAQQLRKAARDLITNLSAHGYGMAVYAALDLQDQIKLIMRVLSDQAIRDNCGAKDMWQVVEYYSVTELGTTRTSTRFRTLATCGAIITAWLANHIPQILHATGPIIDLDEVRSPQPRSSGQLATSDPTDADLIDACHLWQAESAITDERSYQMAQSHETPVMTSRPVQIPSIARDMLEDAGVGLGMGVSTGYGNGRLGTRA